jgi:ATP-dependent Clp protease protease subunit
LIKKQFFLFVFVKSIFYHFEKDNMNYNHEFLGYYTKHLGKSSSNLDYYRKQVENSMTPYVLEERELRATQIDIFSRLMRDRILWVAGAVNDNMSTIVQAQLMFLNSVDKTDITMHIDSPGGSVKSGLSMVDVMNFIDCDIRTINTGMAASMGSVLLGAGTKGKRSSLRFSRTMLHQSSGGYEGNIQDAKINFIEWEKINNILFELLGEYCGKTAKQVKKDAERDLWLDSKEALEYGIIDEVVQSKKEKGVK